MQVITVNKVIVHFHNLVVEYVKVETYIIVHINTYILHIY